MRSREGQHAFNLELEAIFADYLGALTVGQNDKDPAGGASAMVEFGGPIMNDFQRKRRAEGRVWAEGYTQTELDVAQAKYAVVFPPDLVALLRDRRPALGYDWRSDDNEIREMLKWPLKGLLFSVENNALWWPEWGDKPGTADGRLEVLTKVVSNAPMLIPLFSHRYLPAEPNEAGNPVFSVYGSDVIYYGSDLENYFEREFVDPRQPLPHPIKRVRFWSDLVERNR